MKKKRKNKNDICLLIIAIISLIFGLVILFYPTVSNYLEEQNQIQVIQKYEEKISSSISEDMIEEELKKAETYNYNLSGEKIHDPFIYGSGYAMPENYLEILNIKDGVMGYIEIPKISLNLPIYHGTSQEVLEKGVGHIEVTTLPIGGTSRHCVLTGHRGLPSAKLFTELDKLQQGDYFNIHILNKVLSYKIYNIEVIEPTEIEKLQIIPNRDLVTLITCTPYGVNTHRLLVHAERTEDIKEEVKEQININQILSENKVNYAVIGLIFVLIIIVITIYIIMTFRKRKKRETD